jgi:acetoacetyl-CoA reductase
MPRLAVVTGGTRGIGREISRALQRAGHTVVANYHTGKEAAAAFHTETGIAVEAWDVADYGACEAAVGRIVAAHGPIEILINNAGITRDTFLHRMPAEAWHQVIETNLTSCFNMCRLVIASMRERGFGRIVNVASINGQAGQVGQTNYSAAKAGVIGFTKALALESAAKGITVNAVAPGYILTDMVKAVPEGPREEVRKKIPVGRFGEPEEIAHAVLYLVSDSAGFVTGSTLTVNGGQYLT